MSDCPPVVTKDEPTALVIDKRPTPPRLLVPLLCLAILAALAALCMSAYTNRKLTRELAQLRAEVIRYGQPVEIHNPKWGTVIDGVDPNVFPSRDVKDPRRGAMLQQFIHRGNDAQRWVLRPPSETQVSPPPLPMSTYMAQVNGFIRARDYLRAKDVLEHCIELFPDQPEVHVALARTYRDLNAYASALNNHDRSIQLDSERAEFYWERGVTHLRVPHYDEAIRDFKAALERNATFADALNSLGIAYRSKGELETAIRHHDEAVALGPQREDFYRERALTLQKMGEADKAEADLAKARQLKRPVPAP
ncbi:MAG TPA: tetratricopeptide repeat protein [Candidatus Saccharimonadales bacterium]|nr:tetratricopeptide repeat protein [Candidatus Saccharimonadales bacterium]